MGKFDKLGFIFDGIFGDIFPERTMDGFGEYAYKLGRLSFMLSEADNENELIDGKAHWKYIDVGMLNYYGIKKGETLDAREMFITQYDKGVAEARNEKKD